jgi:integrase
MNEPREEARGEPRREGRIFARGKRGFLWIAWYDADGHEQRESTKSTDPRVADRKLRAKLTDKERGVRHVPGARRVTVADLVDGLRDYHESRGTKSWPRFRQAAAHIREHFGDDARAADLDYPALEGYAKARRRKGAAAATIRGELATLSQAFKIARKRGLVATTPVFPTVTVRNTRTACFTDKELAAILVALPGPVRPVVEFASLTGWRLRECVGLRWDGVSFEDRTLRLKPDETKNGRGRVFPFGTLPRLVALLDRQRQERWRVERERGIHVGQVFHRDGRPITDKALHHVWLAACRRAELEDRHFHDLRRYAAQRLVKAGVARTEAMALMGHETESMFVRYALNDLPMLEKAVAKVAALDRS